MEGEKANRTLSNQSSEKLLALIEYMSTLEEPIRLSDLAAGSGMNASTLSRFLTTLIHCGYVKKDEKDGRYSLTYKICGIANSITSRIDIRSVALPYLKRISRTFSCTANLIMCYGQSCIYLEVIAAPDQIMLPLQRIGKVAPLYCTAAGKLLLQEFSPEQMHEYVSTTAFDRYTDTTITSAAELESAVEEARVKGYAVDNEECEIGTCCLAVPVRNYSGHICAAISINGPSTRINSRFIEENSGLLKEIVSGVSKDLGYQEET